jgi:hypothetical protein
MSFLIYFSIHIDYYQACSFHCVSADLEIVIFEINANPKMISTKSFGDISRYSDFIQQAEVLFMLGSIFCLNSIDRTDDQIWIIRMI